MGLIWEDEEAIIFWVKDNGDNNSNIITGLGKEGVGTSLVLNISLVLMITLIRNFVINILCSYVLCVFIFNLRSII